MAHLHPYIFSNDAKSQAEFYVKALGGEIFLSRSFADTPGDVDEAIKDKIFHLRLRAAGQVFYMSDLMEESVNRGNGLDLVLEFEDVEETRKVFNGLAEGGNVLMDFEKQVWGNFSGMVQDQFGVRWQIATIDTDFAHT